MKFSSSSRCISNVACIRRTIPLSTCLSGLFPWMSYEFGFSGFCTHAAEYCQRSLCPYICLARPSWWRLPKEELPPAPVQRTCCMTQLLGTDDACACIFCLYRSAWDSDSLTDVKRQWTKNTSIGRCEFGQTFLASAAFLLVVRSRKMTFRWPFLPKTATNWLHFLQTTKFITHLFIDI